MSSIEYTSTSSSVVTIGECALCGENKELTYLGECPCIHPHACFECYNEMYARYFVEMDGDLICPFCRSDVGYNMFDPVNLAMVGLSIMDAPSPTRHQAVVPPPMNTPTTPLNVQVDSRVNNVRSTKRKRNTEINNRSVRRKLFD